MNNKEVFSKNLSRFLDDRDLTPTEFARIMGYPETTVFNWVHGKTYPRIDRVQQMADYFNIYKSELTEKKEIDLESIPGINVIKNLQKTLDNIHIRVYNIINNKTRRKTMTNLNIELKREFLWDLDEGYKNFTHKIFLDGKKVGSAEIIYKEDEDEQYVENIFVDKGFRGQGIATEVLNRLADEYEFVYFAAADEYSQGLYEHIAEEYNGKNIEVGQGYGVFFIEA